MTGPETDAPAAITVARVFVAPHRVVVFGPENYPMRLLLALVCCLSIFALRAEEAAAPAANPLSGTSWAITIVSSDGEKTDDVLTIDATTLASQTYAEARFAPGPVTVKGTAEKAEITAHLAEPNGREMVLKGKIADGKIEGSIAVGVRGQFEKSTFSGSKK